MSKMIDITGRTFGRWTVIIHVGKNRQRRTLWNCRCQCGNSGVVNSQDLRDGHSKSCGCINDERIGALRRSKDSGLNKLLRQYKASAKIRGLEFSLELDEFVRLTGSECHYCGDKPARISVKHSPVGAYTYNGIDRKNNTIGYIAGNSVACCYECNFLKREIGYDEFVARIKKIYDKVWEEQHVKNEPSW